MGWAGFGRTQLRYDMFDMVRTTKEAQRLSECEQMYHPHSALLLAHNGSYVNFGKCQIGR